MPTAYITQITMISSSIMGAHAPKRSKVTKELFKSIPPKHSRMEPSTTLLNIHIQSKWSSPIIFPLNQWLHRLKLSQWKLAFKLGRAHRANKCSTHLANAPSRSKVTNNTKEFLQKSNSPKKTRMETSTHKMDMNIMSTWLATIILPLQQLLPMEPSQT